MMTPTRLALSSGPRWLWISTLLVAAALLSPAYHCGFPLVAFVTIAALTSARQDALLASGAVLLTHQTLVFASQHHHTSGMALSWAVAFVAIALLCCETAGFVWRRRNGFIGAAAAFVAAYAVYEIAVVAMSLASGRGAESVTLATVTRMFLRNFYAFGGLWGLSVIGAAIRFDRLRSTSPALRHI
jgi:hypothetical protein